MDRGEECWFAKNYSQEKEKGLGNLLEKVFSEVGKFRMDLI